MLPKRTYSIFGKSATEEDIFRCSIFHLSEPEQQEEIRVLNGVNRSCDFPGGDNNSERFYINVVLPYSLSFQSELISPPRTIR